MLSKLQSDKNENCNAYFDTKLMNLAWTCSAYLRAKRTILAVKCRRCSLGINWKYNTTSNTDMIEIRWYNF